VEWSVDGGLPMNFLGLDPGGQMMDLYGHGLIGLRGFFVCGLSSRLCVVLVRGSVELCNSIPCLNAAYTLSECRSYAMAARAYAL